MAPGSSSTTASVSRSPLTMRAAMACHTGTGAIRSRFSNALTRAIVSSGCMPPAGLVYRPELLGEAEERALFAELERLDFHEIRKHGVAAKRTALHFAVGPAHKRPAAPPQ